MGVVVRVEGQTAVDGATKRIDIENCDSAIGGPVMTAYPFIPHADTIERNMSDFLFLTAVVRGPAERLSRDVTVD